jgi:hypothetical protein
MFLGRIEKGSRYLLRDRNEKNLIFIDFFSRCNSIELILSESDLNQIFNRSNNVGVGADVCGCR